MDWQWKEDEVGAPSGCIQPHALPELEKGTGLWAHCGEQDNEEVRAWKN